jgi:hypothetical protein
VKLGEAFDGIPGPGRRRHEDGFHDAEGFWRIWRPLSKNLRTDHVDIYQFHNPPFCPKPGDESGMYDAALEAKRQGKIRHIAHKPPAGSGPLAVGIRLYEDAAVSLQLHLRG